ncbi:MAG: hypothetical protein AB1736_00265 [Chloroflexota bacterium]
MTLKRALSTLERAAGAVRAEPGAADGLGSSRFVRGLTIGALVGAAIAGSTIWQRRRVRGRIRRELTDPES